MRNDYNNWAFSKYKRGNKLCNLKHQRLAVASWQIYKHVLLFDKTLYNMHTASCSEYSEAILNFCLTDAERVVKTF